MSRKGIPFHEYLISLGAKKNWFENESRMKCEIYFQRKIYDGRIINEIGIKSQSTLSKLLHNENNYLPFSKIFPKKSNNLFNFNMFNYHDSDFPFKEVLFSEGSFEEVEKKYLLALNEIKKKDIKEGRNNDDDDFDYVYDNDYHYSYEEYYEEDEDHTEGILESNQILIQKLNYPESYDVDNETGYGAGNLSIFDLEFKELYFLEKPFGSQYFLLWGNKNEIKYFLPLKFIEETNFLDVIVKDQ